MPIFQGVYTITNMRSQTHVDLAGGNPANGTVVQGWSPLPQDNPYLPNQLWKVQYTNKLGVDSYTISNVGSGRYLEIKDGNGMNGAPVTCSAATTKEETQEWELIKTDSKGYYNIRNVMSQTCLDMDSGLSANGTRIQGWSGQLGNQNQLWAFTPAHLANH
ncbi:ricin B lectin domain-containing protein [Mycena galopus ATCC 62051]|nr:ricin B lectin domain-containing protein [Mycena galopus ATCC 62051]